MYDDLIKWLENHQGTCYYKRYLGIDCPGCGMQRAFVELLKGHIWDSILMYPALIPMIFIFVLLILHLIFKFKHGATILKISFIFTVGIVIINFIVKLIK